MCPCVSLCWLDGNQESLFTSLGLIGGRRRKFSAFVFLQGKLKRLFWWVRVTIRFIWCGKYSSIGLRMVNTNRWCHNVPLVTDARSGSARTDWVGYFDLTLMNFRRLVPVLYSRHHDPILDTEFAMSEPYCVPIFEKSSFYNIMLIWELDVDLTLMNLRVLVPVS